MFNRQKFRCRSSQSDIQQALTKETLWINTQRLRLGFEVISKAQEWNDECDRTFEALKTYLANPPLLSQAKRGEVLKLYLPVSPQAVSSMLVCDEGGKQRPMYYTSRAFWEAEVRYPRIELLIFALIITARRLRPYFLAHPSASSRKHL